MSLDKVHVVIGVLSNGTWHGEFGMCLVKTMTHFMRIGIRGVKSTGAQVHHAKGSILPRGRMAVVKTALTTGATHVLFIDSDQTFPKDTLQRLVGWDKDIVACNIAVKKIPSTPTARAKPGPTDHHSGRLIYTDEESQGLEPVWRIGCGIILIKSKVFQHPDVGVKSFGMPWKEELQDYQGEDWSFCEAAEKAGFQMYIDHGLSWHIGHLGDYEFKHDVVGVVVQQEAA